MNRLKTLAVTALSASAVLLVAARPALADSGSPTEMLRAQLTKTPAAGKYVTEFKGPGGLTGVILELPNKQRMLVYMTPDGRYMISGVVFDLMNNANLTAQYAHEYLGSPKQPSEVVAGAALYRTRAMTSVVFGNPKATSYMVVVFDPATPEGRKVMFETMNEAAKIVHTPLFAHMHIDFIPVGPDAAQILDGNTQQRLNNLLAYAEHKPLPAPTKNAQSLAAANTAQAKTLGVELPAMIAFLPGMKSAKAVSFAHATGALPSEVQAMINMTGGGLQ
jgi:thiol:disulfide interchange protein DsbG